jgi:branched-chain amino acid aminotransferase
MSQVWLNGSLVDEAEAGVSLRDTGLLHAAGVFTTMRSSGGRVFRLSQHFRRLRESCDALSIPLPYRDQELSAAVEQLLAGNGLTDARLRLTITRGKAETAADGIRLQPAVFITAVDLQPYPDDLYQRGMTVIVLDDQKLNPYDIQAGHKTLNYLSRLAALRSANQRGAGEALWFNVHNYLQSGSISNVFIVKDGRLLTPPTPADLRDPAVAEAISYPRSAVLPGITRGTVIEIAQHGSIDIAFASINISDLLEADEVFITNSIMGVMPVCRIERRAIASDKPGPITQRISTLLAEIIRMETAP